MAGTLSANSAKDHRSACYFEHDGLGTRGRNAKSVLQFMQIGSRRLIHAAEAEHFHTVGACQDLFAIVAAKEPWRRSATQDQERISRMRQPQIRGLPSGVAELLTIANALLTT